MAAGGSGMTFVKPKRTKGLLAHLTSAACEWFLIFLLLVDAALSFLLTKFASYCQLQLPCLLCSRLDYILGGEKPEFYQNLFCSHHKLKISSLILCHCHGKVAEGHRMCDDCLLSFTTSNRPDTKTHRLLVGKLGGGGSGFQSPSLSRDLFTVSKGSRPCICCGKLWNPEQNARISIQLKSPGRAVLKPHVPLPHVSRQSCLDHRENSKKVRDKFSRSEGKSHFQPISHIGYSELRLNSDSESEFPFSDDDDDVVGSVIHENIEACKEPTVIPQKHIVSDSNPIKSDRKPLSADLPELISLDEVSQTPIAVNISNGESQDSKITPSLSQNSLPTALSELMTLDGTHASIEASPDQSIDVTQASGTGLISKKQEEVFEKIATREKLSIETVVLVSDSAPITPRQENSGKMRKSPITTEEREEPDFVIEHPSTMEVDKVKEELELPPSHNSPHGSNISAAVPINQFHSPEMHTEASSSNGMQELQKSASVGSGLESLDGSSNIEIEGESSVDELKQKIEYYKKCMDALHKDLEEERNASAIATNEAMSMITRLQEEKAALQMEALQFLRMMEEQAEYDNDELQKVNDLLTEKEKEIQDLEAELEFYRLNFTDEPVVHSMHKESCDSAAENVTQKNVGVNSVTNNENTISYSKLPEVSKASDEAEAGGRSLEFEEEKLYISQCLKSLEKKLRQINKKDHLEEEPEVSESNQQRSSNGEETDLSIQTNMNMSNGNHSNKDISATSDGDDCSLKENHNSIYFGPKSSMPSTVDLVALGNEISDLNDRLEALEFNHDLLEHIINSLQNGDDGKQIIQDIAHQLHELQKIGTRSR